MRAQKKTWPPWIVSALKATYACALGLFFGFLYVVFTGQLPVLGKMRALQAMSAEQQKLPGAAELRTDGCQQVIVSTPAFRAKHHLVTARGRSKDSFVTCMPFILRAPPTCDRLARHYAAVAHPTGPINVSVVSPRAKDACNDRFDSNGTPIVGDAGL